MLRPRARPESGYDVESLLPPCSPALLSLFPFLSPPHGLPSTGGEMRHWQLFPSARSLLPPQFIAQLATSAPARSQPALLSPSLRALLSSSSPPALPPSPLLLGSILPSVTLSTDLGHHCHPSCGHQASANAASLRRGSSSRAGRERESTSRCLASHHASWEWFPLRSGWPCDSETPRHLLVRPLVLFSFLFSSSPSQHTYSPTPSSPSPPFPSLVVFVACLISRGRSNGCCSGALPSSSSFSSFASSPALRVQKFV